LNSKVCRRSWINYGPVSTEKSTAVILLLRPNEPGLKVQNGKRIKKAEDSKEKRIEDLEKERRKREEEARKE
jgi:hypothetical protein